MRIIKQSFEILEQPSSMEGMFKHIEQCGRVSYKSEDKITDDSAKSFVDKLFRNGHYSPLEHGTVFMTIDNNEIFPEIEEAFIAMEPYMRSKYYDNNKGSYFCVTTNFRVIHETKNGQILYREYGNEASKDHVQRITVKMITNRAIANEFVRHRRFSFTQESTRYCNYSKGKFDNSLTFIRPHWFTSKLGNSTKMLTHDEQIWENTMYEIEKAYMKLIKEGAKPEDVRGLLPLDLKTELVMTGFVDDWKRFFDLRCANNAHPQAKELASVIKDAFITKGIDVL